MLADGPLTDDKKTDAQKPAADPAPDPNAAPVDPAAAPDPNAPDPADPADAPDPNAAKPEDAPAAVPNPLDVKGMLPAEKLAASFEDPEFAAAMEKQGYSKDQLMETARNAALAEEFVEVVGTPRAAKFATEAAGHFYDIEEGFTGIKNIQDFDGFMTNVMVPLSYVLGPDGNPQMNADGKSYKTDGSVSRFMSQAVDFELGIIDSLIKKAPQDNDDVKDVQAALEILGNFRKNGYKVGPAAPPLTPEQQQRETEIAEREKTLNTATANARKADVDRFETRITDATDKELTSLIGATLKPTALSPELRKKAEDDIYLGLQEALAKDRTFKFMAGQERAHGMSEETYRSIVALNVDTLKSKFRDVAKKVLTTYGAHVVKQNADTRGKTDAQIEADRLNPKVGTVAGRSTRTPLTADQIEQQAADQVLAANGGKRPADYSRQLLDKIMELESKQNPLRVA